MLEGRIMASDIRQLLSHVVLLYYLLIYMFIYFHVAKGRRQPKAVKPKKMIRLEAKTVVFAACNNGSSAVITKEGGVYMFGKDTAHCHQSSGKLKFLLSET